MTEAYIGLGSNLGDRDRHLDQALEGLEALGTVVATSSVYETAPIGGPPQDPFLNMVAVLETELAPRPLLDGMLAIEERSGRVRGERMGPRSLDLDLLLHGEEEIDEPGLRLPHPRLAVRRFVLEPLLEVRPRAKLPDGTKLKSFLAEVQHQEVRRRGRLPRRPP